MNKNDRFENTRDDKFENMLEQKPYCYIEQQFVKRIHHFYISQHIEEPEKYIEMIHIIQSAGADSNVHIHLNTPGGMLATGSQLINAMQSSEAHVICSLEGEVASLGTMIFLAADEFLVHNNALMMFHNYSGGVFGKGHEQIAALEATTQWVDTMMKCLYVPFMSEDEFNSIKKGEDLYFHAEEIRTRLTKMVKALDKEAKEEENKKERPKKPSAKKKKG